MHGAGNDYVYVDARHEIIPDPETLAVQISDRHFGVGADGLVLIMNSDVADFRMRMFNADGTEAGMCGNASRCVAKYVYEKGLTTKTEISLETVSGIKQLSLTLDTDRVKEISVDMNTPATGALQIPILCSDTLAISIEVEGVGLTLTCVSMGNPHAVVFVDDVEHYEVEKIGRAIETHPLFPQRCNVEFVEVVSADTLRMRVWERGSGETLACGTGACAALVAAVLNGLCDREATVVLRGGSVQVAWSRDTGRVTLIGGAEWVFCGEYYQR